MRIIEIQGITGKSTLLIGEKLQNLHRYLPKGKTVIITDENVSLRYKKDFPPCDVITIGTGEGIKTLDTAQDIFRKLIALEVDRSSFIVGIGGGIVCDITGFVASTYMRGVKFGFVSSTLLSQVDASVGGKNGVNLVGYKNMIGVFNQPEFVICDLNLLQTLPEKEILCGMAEIIKHAAIADPYMFAYLETNHEKAIALDLEVIETLVYDSIRIKSAIVNRDETEKGERRKLNFGHTIGHAIEKTTGLPHGQAISIGMMAASAISVNRGLLTINESKRIEKLLKNLKLPTHLVINKENVLDAMRKDKKRAGNDIYFILLQSIGNAIIDKISIKELEAAI